MKKGISYLVLLAFLTINNSFALAEMIQVNGRYFVEKSTVEGYFYSTGDKENFVVLNIIFGKITINGPRFSQEFICKEKWEWDKIKKATNGIVEHINKRDNVDFAEMLGDLGFKKCSIND
ncbi:MAG: hypothetical protein CSA32_04110 [Desulfobulbus propionicus]|nr:MAG: hypothetical protein CSA32_04110 [Desulfobulbus propionicus]